MIQPTSHLLSIGRSTVGDQGGRERAPAVVARLLQPVLAGGYHVAMHATYRAALTVFEQSIDMMRDAVKDMPDAALDWTPASGMSSVAVLVMHSVTATRAFAGVGAGVAKSQKEYREEDRAEAFRTRSQSTPALVAALDALRGELPVRFEAAPEGMLERETEWVDDTARRFTGAECLFRAVGHLREHVGHVQVMRDLWMTSSREGR